MVNKFWCDKSRKVVNSHVGRTNNGQCGAIKPKGGINNVSKYNEDELGLMQAIAMMRSLGDVPPHAPISTAVCEEFAPLVNSVTNPCPPEDLGTFLAYTF